MGILKTIRNNEIDRKTKEIQNERRTHMEIISIELNNFRNIKHAVYELGKVNCIEAKNHLGKTNTITAVNWLVTGKMLDGSSNDISLKPIGNTQEKVSVRLEIKTDSGRTHTIERTYNEKWTKTRGSEEVNLTGHETTFIVDDIVQKRQDEALEEINGLLGIDETTFNKVKNIDAALALMNPLYLAETLEWKSLRQLIISIIGDVQNDEVFTKAEETLIAKDMLEQYNYDVEKVVTYCRQQIAEADKKVIELEAQIDLLEKTEDIPTERMEELNEQIHDKQKTIESLTAGINTTNPEIERLKKVIADKEADYNAKATVEKMEFINKIDADQTIKNNLSSTMNNKATEKNNKELAVETLKNDLRCKDNQILEIDRKINDLKVSKDKMLATYYKLKKEEFIQGEIKVCPNCGHVLNQEELDERKAAWDKEHGEALDNNLAEGKKCKLEIDDKIKEKIQIEEDMANIKNKLAAAEKEKQAATEAYNLAKEEYSNFVETTPKLEDFKVSEALQEFGREIDKDKQALRFEELKPNPTAEQNKETINKISEEINALKEEQGKHYVYLNDTKKCQELVATKRLVIKQKIRFESIKEAAMTFNKTKLEILDARLAAHFGEEVKWVLVENNIKEGSWNNVCYPLIIGTKTPFKNGSTSEKVITGIKIIEILKRELKAPDLPLLIDEIGELDSDSIASLKDITKAQIIATRVNDAYLTPTVKTL